MQNTLDHVDLRHRHVQYNRLHVPETQTGSVKFNIHTFVTSKLYLDFKKALDEVTHCRLKSNVRDCGVEGRVSNWSNNWLNGKRTASGLSL